MWSCIRVLYSLVFSSITVYLPLGTIHFCHMYVCHWNIILAILSLCAWKVSDYIIVTLLCFWSASQTVAMLSCLKNIEVSLLWRSISVRRKNYQYPRSLPMVSATTGQTSLQGAVAGREGENHLAKNATQFFQQKTQKHTPKILCTSYNCPKNYF